MENEGYGKLKERKKERNASMEKSIWNKERIWNKHRIKKERKKENKKERKISMEKGYESNILSIIFFPILLSMIILIPSFMKTWRIILAFHSDSYYMEKLDYWKMTLTADLDLQKLSFMGKLD